MLQTIALYGGIVGMVVAVLALIVIVLIKKDVADALNKDVVLFDKNFELKKSAIEKCFKLLDDLEQTPAVAKNAEFVRRAKESYNELICVVTDLAIAEQFLTLTVKNGSVDAATLYNFKLKCRKDIGFSTKHASKQFTSTKK